MKNKTDTGLGNANADNSARKEVGAVVNAISILRHLAYSNEPDGVTMIARATGISPSTTFNILRTLTNQQLLAFDVPSKTYRLGIGLAEIVGGLIGVSPSQLVQPELDRISAWTDALTVLWRRVDDELVVVARGVITNAVRVETAMGMHLPLYTGAIGRCMVATEAPGLTALRTLFGKLTFERPPSFKEYDQQIKRTIEQGWALDDSQTYFGVTGVAAAIRDGEGRAHFGISAVMLTNRREVEELRLIGEDIKRTCDRISAVLYQTQKSKNSD